MQAKDFYDIGLRAYNGNLDARLEYFEKFSSIVIPIAKKYGLLPSYVMAKSVCETGYMTDAWNATAEKLSGKKFKRKAQDYNNIFCMNCWGANQEYLDYLPIPAWNSYKATFEDYGTHGYGTTFHVKLEPWKSYKTVEDAVEDWCANIRCQSAKHGFEWNPTDLKSQLLATESYTPEGSPDGVRAGLHYQWQESIMSLYEQYGLKKYDDMVVEEEVVEVPFENRFTGEKLFDATVKSRRCVARELAGKKNKLLFSIPKDEIVPVYASVTTSIDSRWFYVQYDGKYGWVHRPAFDFDSYKITKDMVTVTGTPDNSLTCRVGAGTEYPIYKWLPSLKNGTKVRMVNNLVAADGSKWSNVYYSGYFFFVSSMYLK